MVEDNYKILKYYEKIQYIFFIVIVYNIHHAHLIKFD